MYAVFADGSRQYRVGEGDLVRVDFRDIEPGSSVEFERVLLYQSGQDTQVGRPTVAGVKVVGEVVDHPTVKHYIQKYRRRKTYRRLRGHRQPFTAVRIKSIVLPGQQAKAESKETPAETPAAKTEKAAETKPVKSEKPAETKPAKSEKPAGKEPAKKGS
jgi:large subunit ribosomal protein L21